MVFFAECNLCDKNIYGVTNIWLPWCMICVKTIENFYFCDNCVKAIYDYKKHTVKVLDINCGNCVTQRIGFDNRRQQTHKHP